MFISVIIPTRNRQILLEKTCASLTKQTLSPEYFELIVVDNSINSNVKSFCQKISKCFLHSTYIHEPRPGLHNARHKGLKTAIGDILVYGDDDIIASPLWLESILTSFSDTKVMLVGGKILPEYEINPPGWVQDLWVRTDQGKVLSYYSLIDFGDSIHEISPFYVWGCNFSIRRELLIKMKGFHPDAFPKQKIRYRGDGESGLARKLTEKGIKASYNSNAIVYHWISKKRMTLEYLQERAFNQGISDSYTLIRKRNGLYKNDTETKTGSSKMKKLLCLLGNKQFKETMKLIGRNMKSILQSVSLKKNSGIDKIKDQLKKSYQAGFRFHQQEIKNDKVLLAWVIKENYLD